MKLRYLGTAAAEGIPALFCTCPICADAKKKGGKSCRSRSQALVDNAILLDFPPDTYSHYLRFGFDLPAIRHLFITHSHTDHFYPEEFEMRVSPFARQEDIDTLNVYGNRKVEEGLERVLAQSLEQTRTLVSFQRAAPFRAIEADGYRVTPLAAKHSGDEDCLFYALEHQGQGLLYAHDSGVFPEDTWKYLESADLQFDLVSLDCTVMRHHDRDYHMGIDEADEVRGRLIAIGAASAQTVFVLNHFSHNGDWTFDELVEEAGKRNFQVAWDGREIVV
jgi:phosphoribosyl 1,2-cyclic phosphate phosphodiesterase